MSRQFFKKKDPQNKSVWRYDVPLKNGKQVWEGMPDGTRVMRFYSIRFPSDIPWDERFVDSLEEFKEIEFIFCPKKVRHAPGDGLISFQQELERATAYERDKLPEGEVCPPPVQPKISLCRRILDKLRLDPSKLQGLPVYG